MYYPYFRGKQFELVAIRETAPLLSRSGFTPIIEPVRETLSGLSRAIRVMQEHAAQSIIIVNPQLGDHSSDNATVSSLIQEEILNDAQILPGVVATSGMTVSQVEEVWEPFSNAGIAVIHAGFTEAESLAAAARRHGQVRANVFLEDLSGKLYRRHFRSLGKAILVKDGFTQRKNRDYPEEDSFSELHITYPDEGVDAFGDFLIVGDNYSETGGPAYAVAIHLTYVDQARDGAMFVRHFVSDRKDTPQDPAGKFGEALAKLVQFLDANPGKLLESSAIREFRDLHADHHFPGLGYVKKLSMKHHLEVLADFFDAEGRV